MEMPITIFDVADYFLHRVETDEGSSITNLKLQKLCYYAQAWHLALYGKPLFDEDFEAWVHGPVNVELYNKYRVHSWENLPPPENFDPSKFTDEQLDFLDEIWDVYGIYDGKYLERLTHQEKPWQEAREGYGPTERCNEIISKGTMKNYYRSMLKD